VTPSLVWSHISVISIIDVVLVAILIYQFLRWCAARGRRPCWSV